jgi:uracil-DNA glycosylase
MPTHGFLERWAKQGVLMLNSVLTVRKGEAFSHKGKGWEEFTDEIIRCLYTRRSEDAGGLVFLLWGKPASKKAESIINRHTSGFVAGKSKVPTKVFCSSHPSPLGATKTNAPFIGSKCFKKTNEALVEMNMTPIDWGVDGNIRIGGESESDTS